MFVYYIQKRGLFFDMRKVIQKVLRVLNCKWYTYLLLVENFVRINFRVNGRSPKTSTWGGIWTHDALPTELLLNLVDIHEYNVKTAHFSFQERISLDYGKHPEEMLFYTVRMADILKCNIVMKNRVKSGMKYARK